MGRSLFSQKINPEPAIREVLQQGPEHHSSYTTWSIWNAFDPDSDDFFKDAEYEAFIEPAQYSGTQVLVDDHMPPLLEDPESGSSSSDDSDSNPASPMAVGSDDPASLLAGTREWAMSSDIPAQGSSELTGATPAAAAAPPLHYSVPDQTGNRVPSTPLPVFPGRHFRNVSADIPVDTEMPEFASSPLSSSPFVSTPSPAPSVSPLLYNWHRRFIATSPSLSREPVGPLTNPTARMSLTRIPPAPARVRIEGFTV
jgi:hypothetical protein